MFKVPKCFSDCPLTSGEDPVRDLVGFINKEIRLPLPLVIVGYRWPQQGIATLFLISLAHKKFSIVFKCTLKLLTLAHGVFIWAQNVLRSSWSSAEKDCQSFYFFSSQAQNMFECTLEVLGWFFQFLPQIEFQTSPSGDLLYFSR
jgi:hypothetical protein